MEDQSITKKERIEIRVMKISGRTTLGVEWGRSHLLGRLVYCDLIIDRCQTSKLFHSDPSPFTSERRDKIGRNAEIDRNRT